jgi:hypothetical protein
MTFLFLAFAGLFLVPVALSIVFHFKRDRILDWRNADRSSAGLLPPPIPEAGAVVRIFSARTVRWRGIVATHSWVVVKEAGAAKYSRFDYTAWGEPIWIDRFVPDGRWFGRAPEVVFGADGGEAERMIPLIRQAVRQYTYLNIGDYRVWPGPNSNTFVAAIIAAVPACARLSHPRQSARIFRLTDAGSAGPHRVPGSGSIWEGISVFRSGG